MQKIRPTFLGIGAHKAGTSWLYYQLSQHQEVWLPPLKEIHFFDRSTKYLSPNDLSVSSPVSRFFGSQPWEIRRRILQILKYYIQSTLHLQFKESLWWQRILFGHYDKEWYCDLFSQADQYQEAGEITPSYSMLESEDIAKIKSINPHMKIIFLIRNPIDRAWSATRFNYDRGYSNVDLKSSQDIIRSLKDPATTLRGDYERTLNAYLEHFDASQILVCFYDAIQNDPISLVSSITDFLGVKRFEQSSIDSAKRLNQSPQSSMPKDVIDFLNETYSPMIDRLAVQFGSYAQSWQVGLESLSSASSYQLQADQYLPAVHP